jgi:hypothetical protein
MKVTATLPTSTKHYRLLIDAIVDAEPDRLAFLLRLERSLHRWGSLTPAMVQAVTAGSSL